MILWRTAAFPFLLVAVLSLTAPVGRADTSSGVESSGVEVEVRDVRLSEDRGRADQLGKLVYRGGLHITSPDQKFGGFSSLKVLEDGTTLLAVSDRGALLRARLTYADDGRLSGLMDASLRMLPDSDGQPVTGKRSDAESLAALPGGAWAVGFERQHRVMRYASGFDRPPTVIEVPPEVAALPDNDGLESLVSLPDGRLLLISQASEGNGRHRFWLGRDGAWSTGTYIAERPFEPVDAVLLPDGGLVVVERRASYWTGFGARIVRVPAAAVSSVIAGRADTMQGEELGRFQPDQVIDNYEAVDVRVLPNGRTLLYLLSDDNFERAQRTLVLMFELPPAAPK